MPLADKREASDTRPLSPAAGGLTIGIAVSGWEAKWGFQTVPCRSFLEWNDEDEVSADNSSLEEPDKKKEAFSVLPSFTVLSV